MDGGGIFLLDDRREYLVCRSHKGVSEEFVGKLGKVKLGEDMPGIVALKMKPIIINDISSEPRTDSHTLNVLKKAEMKSYACIPIKRREEVQGVFCLFSKNQRPFLNTEIELLSSIGEMIGVAIENIRLYQMEKDIKSQLFEAVASERSKAESLLYGIADGVYSANIERQIISWNPSAEKITGFKAEEVIGKPCKEVLKHTDEEGHSLCESFCPFLSIVYKGERFSGEMYSNTSSGHRIPIHLSSGPVLDAKGTVIGSVSVFRDITHKKEIERMKTEFVRTVSHEFRAPLSAIVGMTEMLIDKEVNGSEKVEKYLKTIYDEGERLSRMVNEFLDIAMIESGKKVLKKQRINITDLFKECITSVSQNAARKDIKIKLLTQDRLFIDADREAMCQMILNLLTNSLTYSDNGTYVKLNAYPMEKRGENLIEITVEDTGWGISKKDLPHIFEKFYRSPLHQKKVKGTGLGLSLVQEIVNAYKGDIKVESRIGEGTKFTISLPVKA
ncbi:MAG: PAS domain-containing protein [Nitrospirae bacterium]|nr:PAS domain-containing protein [Nitrospirota bacterium]